MSKYAFSTLGRWEKGGKAEQDVVLSSRVRLARNLEHYSYPEGASKKELQEVRQMIVEAMDVVPKGTSDWMRLDMEQLTERERAALAEQYVITPGYVEALPYRTALVRKDGGASLLIHESDHIRLQVLDGGLEVLSLWKEAVQLETALEDRLSFAFSDTFGYLTSVPTESGTAMSMSVLLHLPGIAEEGLIYKLNHAVLSLGFTMKPFGLTGLEESSPLFYLANQRTFGVKEEKEIQAFETMVRQVVQEERKARKRMEETSFYIEDRVKRAFGLLHSAVLLSYEEALRLLSDVKWGMDSGYLPSFTIEKYHQLMKINKRNTLCCFYENAKDEEEYWRAKAIQELLHT